MTRALPRRARKGGAKAFSKSAALTSEAPDLVPRWRLIPDQNFGDGRLERPQLRLVRNVFVLLGQFGAGSFRPRTQVHAGFAVARQFGKRPIIPAADAGNAVLIEAFQLERLFVELLELLE